MYLKKSGGKKVDIQGLECWLPPEGYILNVLTDKLEKRAIISRSAKKSEQYWQREPLPAWYQKREKDEMEKRKVNPDFSDPEMEQYRNQEWDRRLNGCWFMNNGSAVYLTGLNYMYLQWWYLDIGYPKFRIPDLEYFYFLQYCLEDPDSMGMIEVTKRRFGKTFRCGLFLYEYTSRAEEASSGLQSKTNIAAKRVFSKAIIKPFKKLPRFFRPEYDKSQGITPKTELRFQQTNIKGKRAEEVLDKDELGSVIDYQSSDLVAYDGDKLHRYVADECGKTAEIDVYDRHDVVRYCVLDDEGNIIGKMLYTTTVEEMESGGEAFLKLWRDSDHLHKKDNNRTPSGLYRFFMPSHRTRGFDVYGNPNEKKALSEIKADRQSIEHNPRALSARIRKEPITIEEAFTIDGNKCLYNTILLNNRLQYLTWNEVTERGNFEWEGGKPDTKVNWVKSKNGRWEIVKGFSFDSTDETNNIIKRGNVYLPGNKLRFVSGVDPYDHDVTIDARRSLAALFTFQKNNGSSNEALNRAFICKYLARPNNATLMYEDVLKQCVFFGSPLLFETQKPGIKKHFNARGYGNFLITLPQYDDPGIPSTEPNKNTLVEVTEEYIDTTIDKVYFKDLIQDWLGFEMAKTQKYDLAMAAGWTLVADMGFRVRREASQGKNIKQYFRLYKAS